MPDPAVDRAAPLSILDLAPVVEGSTPAAALRNTLDLARRAEDLGYLRYWVAEHHFAPGVASSSPAVLIAAIAAVTSRIRVGAGAVQLGHQTAAAVAEAFGTLSGLYPGRIDLGLGRSGQKREEAAREQAAGGSAAPEAASRRPRRPRLPRLPRLPRGRFSYERCGGAERRGAADPEKNIAALSAVDQLNARGAGGGQRAADIEDEDRIGVALSIEREGPGQLSRGIEAIDARYERLASQVLTRQVLRDRHARQRIVGGRVVRLSLLCDCIARMYRKWGIHQSGREIGRSAGRSVPPGR